MTDNEKRLEEIKKQYIGKRCMITSKNHPHALKSGTIVSLDHTPAGYGFKVDYDDGQSGYVFKGSDWKVFD